MRRSMKYRAATELDAEAIAELHAGSWRRHYRGALSDAFLDDRVIDDRRSVWVERLQAPSANQHTIVAELDGAVVGFSHTILDEHPTWGALLDNLHVEYTLKRRGVGSALTAASAKVVIENRPSSGLYLWVLEQNTAAQAFYNARAGVCVDREVLDMPGGETAPSLRYAWADPAVLVRRAQR
jgi:ribosomal protein S18 acetylase RimI-like enzyme